ncbi:MAG: hypothetical protein HQL90_04345 [Magnetococcales bacterium]|nr:hypothetical protein [Magnetococcales bacterium]
MKDIVTISARAMELLCTPLAMPPRTGEGIGMHYFLRLAAEESKKSINPHHKVGSVVSHPDDGVIAIGHNHAVADLHGTPMIHAEIAAMVTAKKPMSGCTMYVTHPPCADCSKAIAASGIKKVVFLRGSDAFNAKWKDDCATGMVVLLAAGVDVKEVFEL